MMNYKIEEETFTKAYLWLAKNLINQGVTKAPRGQAISHIQYMILIESTNKNFKISSYSDLKDLYKIK